jgi:putative addiction module killer protein
MLNVVQTDVFARWLTGLKDLQVRARIAARIERVRLKGHFGDVKMVGDRARCVSITGQDIGFISREAGLRS